MSRVSIESMEAVAEVVGVSLERTAKGGKVAWKLTKNGGVVIVQGTQATMDILQFMANAVEESDFTLYAEPIKVRDTVFVNPKSSTKAIMAVVDAPEKSAKEIIEGLRSDGNKVSTGVLTAIVSDVHKVLKYLQSTGRLLTAV